MAFTPDGAGVVTEQQAFEQLYPAAGWVEHDAEVIWATVLSTTRAVIERLRAKKRRIIAIVLTNQRETTVLWDRRSGMPSTTHIVHQLAGPAYRRSLPEAGERGARRRSQRQDRLTARPLFLRDQARMDSGPRAGSTRGGQDGTPRLRHGDGQLSDLARQ